MRYMLHPSLFYFIAWVIFYIYIVFSHWLLKWDDRFHSPPTSPTVLPKVVRISVFQFFAFIRFQYSIHVFTFRHSFFMSGGIINGMFSIRSNWWWWCRLITKSINCYFHWRTQYIAVPKPSGWLRVISKLDALIIDVFNEPVPALRLITRPLIKKL